MHEFAIAQSIKEIIYDNISSYLDSPSLEVELVRVRCGVLSQIVPEVLKEAFVVATSEDEVLKNTKLEIIISPALLECIACKKEYTRESKEEIFLPCPHCGSVSSNRLIEGKEMIVEHIEIENNI